MTDYLDATHQSTTSHHIYIRIPPLPRGSIYLYTAVRYHARQASLPAQAPSHPTQHEFTMSETLVEAAGPAPKQHTEDSKAVCGVH